MKNWNCIFPIFGIWKLDKIEGFLPFVIMKIWKIENNDFIVNYYTNEGKKQKIVKISLNQLMRGLIGQNSRTYKDMDKMLNKLYLLINNNNEAVNFKIIYKQEISNKIYEQIKYVNPKSINVSLYELRWNINNDNVSNEFNMLIELGNKIMKNNKLITPENYYWEEEKFKTPDYFEKLKMNINFKTNDIIVKKKINIHYAWIAGGGENSSIRGITSINGYNINKDTGVRSYYCSFKDGLIYWVYENTASLQELLFILHYCNHANLSVPKPLLDYYGIDESEQHLIFNGGYTCNDQKIVTLEFLKTIINSIQIDKEISYEDDEAINSENAQTWILLRDIISKKLDITNFIFSPRVFIICYILLKNRIKSLY